MLGAVEDPETLKSFAKFAQVLWRSAFLPICRTLLQPMCAVFSLQICMLPPSSPTSFFLIFYRLAFPVAAVFIDNS